LRKEEFRTWLKARSLSSKAIANRVSRAYRVERALEVLGLPFRDLDEAYDRDRLAAIVATLQDVRARARRGERPPAPLVKQATKPENQIGSLLNAIHHYRNFSDDRGDPAGGSWPALEAMRRIFLDRVPDFQSFAQDEGSYWDVERDYKDQLVAEARRVAAAGGTDEAIGSAIYRALCPQEGPPLRWQTLDAVHKTSPLLAGEFDSIQGRLARARGPIVDSLMEAIGAMERLRDEGLPQLARGEILAIAFGIAGAVRPSESAFFKIEKAQKLLRQLGEEPLFRGETIERRDVESWLALLGRVFEIMRDEWQWQPRDLLDVQGFQWIVLDDKWVSPDEEEGDEEDEEVRAAVEPAAAGPDPVNLILYGPPGTGKTYNTAREAVGLCDGSAPTAEEDVRRRYSELSKAGQIHFVTFHQSYSYEDFVEGLRPVTGSDGAEAAVEGEAKAAPAAGFRLEAQPGIFRKVCTLAEEALKNAGRSGGFDLAGRQVFKMSLGRAGIEDHIFDAAVEGGYVVLGWGGEVDWSDPRYEEWQAIYEKWREIEPDATGFSSNITQVWRFRSSMREGDLVVVSEGNSRFRAIGEVIGPYRYEPTDERDYNHRRAVRWLLLPDESLPVEAIYGKPFTMRSCYPLKDEFVKKEALARLLPGSAASPGAAPDQFVLVVDEINRANISKVFGELITLIEPDKRIGARHEIRVSLPYSGDTFGIPSNLHIIGTMNTADRSIALLDTALRRRFGFRELMPEPDLLDEEVDGVPLRAVLRRLNERIEYLFDREHQIGHAFFIRCGSREAIDRTMRTSVIPLLQEYFYEDWEKVALVLGDGAAAPNEGAFLIQEALQAPPGLDDEDSAASERFRWRVRDPFPADAYERLLR